MEWVLVLHIYQPPHQDEGILRRVTDESYERIVSLLDRYPRLRLTLNISGSLIELLERHGLTHVLEGIRRHAEAGRVELVGSAMYHPILPLLPESEVRRQIDLNDAVLRRVFGDSYRREGFYFPEMAFSPEAGRVIRDMGFRWIVLDEFHSPEKPDPAVRHRTEDGLTIVFRDRAVSRTFPPEYVETHFDDMPSPLVTAHDGELWGHWHKDDRGYYERAFADARISFKTVSEYLDGLREERIVPLRTLTWETTQENIDCGHLYPLWNHPENPLHGMLWHFTHGVRALVEGSQDDAGYAAARGKLDRAWASCMWWWASGIQPIGTGPVAWNPGEVVKGLGETLGALQALREIPADVKADFEREHAGIIARVREMHEQKWTSQPAA